MTLSNVLRDAWEIGKKNCVVLTCLGFVYALSTSLMSKSSDPETEKVLQKIASGELQGAKALQELSKHPLWTSNDIIVMIISLLVFIYLTCLIYRYVKKIVDEEEKIDFLELITSTAKDYFMYFLKCFLFGLILIVGFACCVLPGFYLLVRYMFVPYIAANEPELSMKDTMAKSMELTKGRFWTLFGYGIVAGLVEISGLLLCCVGYFFTLPLAYVMLGVVYDELVNEVESE